MSLSSLVLDQLDAYGLPIQYASRLTSVFTGDIITLGLRLALIGLLAAFVRNRATHYKDIVERGGSYTVKALHTILMNQPSFLQPMYRVLPSPGLLLTWPTAPMSKASSSTIESSRMKSWRTEPPRSRMQTRSSSRERGLKAVYALPFYPITVSLFISLEGAYLIDRPGNQGADQGQECLVK